MRGDARPAQAGRWLTMIAAIWPVPLPWWWLILIVLDLDDYVNGDDDDRWRKLREGAKNRVKWLMELPARQPEHGTA